MTRLEKSGSLHNDTVSKSGAFSKIKNISNINETMSSFSHTLDNENESPKIYSPLGDGACFFRAYLAYEKNDPDWLGRNSLEQIYQWIRSEETVFIDSINMALNSVSVIGLDTNTSPELLEIISEMTTKNDFARDLMSFLMTEKELNLWQVNDVHHFVSHYFGVNISKEFCELFIDTTYQMLSEKLAVPINQNQEIYIKRIEEKKGLYHYVLVGPDDLFKQCTSENSTEKSELINNQKQTKEILNGTVNELEPQIEVCYITKKTDGTSFIRSTLAILHNNTEWVDDRPLSSIYDWIIENRALFESAIDKSISKLNFSFLKSLPWARTHLKKTFTSPDFLTAMMSDDRFRLFNKEDIKRYASENKIDITNSDTEAFIKSVIDNLAEQLNMIRDFDGKFYVNSKFHILQVEDTDHFDGIEETISSSEMYFIPVGLQARLEGQQDRSRTSKRENHLKYFKLPIKEDVDLNRFKVLKKHEKGSLYRSWLALVYDSDNPLYKDDCNIIADKLVSNVLFNKCFSKTLNSTFVTLKDNLISDSEIEKLSEIIIKHFFRKGVYDVVKTLNTILSEDKFKNTITSSLLLNIKETINNHGSEILNLNFEKSLIENLGYSCVDEENIRNNVHEVEFFINGADGVYSFVGLKNHFEPHNEKQFLTKKDAIVAGVSLLTGALSSISNLAASYGYNINPSVHKQAKEKFDSQYNAKNEIIKNTKESLDENKKSNDEKSNFLTFPGAEGMPIFNDKLRAEYDKYHLEYESWEKENTPLKRTKRRVQRYDINPNDIINLEFEKIYNDAPSAHLTKLKSILAKPLSAWDIYDDPMENRALDISYELRKAIQNDPKIKQYFLDMLDAVQMTFLERNSDFRKAYKFYLTQNDESLLTKNKFFAHKGVEDFVIKPQSDRLFQHMASNVETMNGKVFSLLSTILHTQTAGLTIPTEKMGMAFAHLDVNVFNLASDKSYHFTKEKLKAWKHELLDPETKHNYDLFKKRMTEYSLNKNVAKPEIINQMLLFKRGTSLAQQNSGICQYMATAMLLDMENNDLSGLMNAKKTLQKIKEIAVMEPDVAYRVMNGLDYTNSRLQYQPVIVDSNTVLLNESKMELMHENVEKAIAHLWSSEKGERVTISFSDEGGGHSIGIGKVGLENGNKVTYIIDANTGMYPCYSEAQFKSQLKSLLSLLPGYDPSNKSFDHLSISTLTMNTDNVNLLKSLKTSSGHSYGDLTLNDLSVFSRRAEITKRDEWNNLFPDLKDKKTVGKISSALDAYKNNKNVLTIEELIKLHQKVNSGYSGLDDSELSTIKISKKQNKHVYIPREDLTQARKISLLDRVVEECDFSEEQFTSDPARKKTHTILQNPFDNDDIKLNVNLGNPEKNKNKNKLGSSLFDELLKSSEIEKKSQKLHFETDNVQSKSNNPILDSAANEIETKRILKDQILGSKERVSSINFDMLDSEIQVKSKTKLSFTFESEDPLFSRLGLSKAKLKKLFLCQEMKTTPPFVSEAAIEEFIDTEIAEVNDEVFEALDLQNHKIAQQFEDIKREITERLTKRGLNADEYSVSKTVPRSSDGKITLEKNGNSNEKVEIKLPEKMAKNFNEISNKINNRIKAFNEAFSITGHKVVKGGKYIATKLWKTYGKGIEISGKIISIYSLISLVDQIDDQEGLDGVAKIGLLIDIVDLSIDQAANAIGMINWLVKSVAQPVSGLSTLSRFSSSVSTGASLIFNVMEIGLYTYSFQNAQTELDKKIGSILLSASIAKTAMTLASMAVCASFPLAAPLFATFGFFISYLQQILLDSVLAKNAAENAFISFEEELKAISELLENIDEAIFDEKSNSLLIVSNKMAYTELRVTDSGIEIKRDGQLFATEFIQTYVTRAEKKPNVYIPFVKDILGKEFSKAVQPTSRNAKIGKKTVRDEQHETSLVQKEIDKVIKHEFKSDNTNQGTLKHIMFSGHPIKPVYQTTHCTKAQFGNSISKIDQKTVKKLSRSDKTEWKMEYESYVQHDKSNPANERNFFEGEIQYVDEWKWGFVPSYYFSAINRVCFNVPNQVKLEISQPKYKLRSDEKQAYIYHFQKDHLLNEIAKNKDRISYGLQKNASLPIETQNITPQMLVYNIEFSTNGHSNLYLYRGTELSVSDNTTVDHNPNSVIKLYLPFETVRLDSNITSKLINNKQKITIKGYISPITGGQTAEPEEDIIINLEPSVKRKVQLNILKQSSDSNTASYILNVNKPANEKDTAGVTLTYVASIPYTSAAETIKNFNKEFIELKKSILNLEHGSFKINNLILNRPYHQTIENNVNTKTKTPEESKQARVVFESAGWYFVKDTENQDHPLVKEHGALLITKIWRNTAPEHLKSAFRSMEYIGRTEVKYKDIPKELMLNFDYNVDTYAYHYFDESSGYLVKQYGDSEIRYWSNQDIKKCTTDAIPQKVYWGDAHTEDFSCGAIHISPLEHSRAITSDRLHLVVNSANIIPDFNSDKNVNNQTLFDFILKQSLLYLQRINDNSFIRNENKTNETVNTNEENILADDDLFMEIVNSKMIDHENKTEAVKLILVQDEKLHLAVIPENESIIAIPKDNVYSLSTRNRTKDEIDELSNHPEDENYIQTKNITDTDQLFKIIIRPVASDTVIENISQSLISNSSEPSFSSTLMPKEKFVLDNIPITLINNRPREKLFICHDNSGVAFSLSHDLKEQFIHSVKEDYLLDHGISQNSSQDISREFCRLELTYGPSAYPYFQMQGHLLQSNNSVSHSIVVNRVTKQVIYIPPSINVNDEQLPISNNTVVTSEGTWLASPGGNVLIQDFDNKRIIDLDSPYTPASSAKTYLPYNYLSISKEKDRMFISVAENDNNNTKEIKTRTLPFLGVKEVVLLPTLNSENKTHVPLELPPLLQNHLNLIILSSPETEDYSAQRISVNTGEENNQRKPKMILKNYGNETEAYLVLPTSKKVNGIPVLSSPLFVLLEDACINCTQINPAFNDTVILNGDPLDLNELLKDAEIIDMSIFN